MRYVPLALLALTACGRTPGPPVPERPRSVHLTSTETRYTVVEHRRVAQAFEGQPVVSEATNSLALSLTLTAGDGAFEAAVLVDSIHVAGDGALPPEAVRAAEGTTLQGRIPASGGTLELVSPASSNPVLEQLALGLHDFLPGLPPNGAAPGREWTDSGSVAGRAAGLPVTIRRRTAYRAGPWDSLGAEPLLQLESEGTYTLTGEGNRLGQWITIRGTGVVRTERRLSLRGEVVFGVRVDSLRVDVDAGNAGLRIPVLETRVDTVRRMMP
jgi:hypothetical protein